MAQVGPSSKIPLFTFPLHKQLTNKIKKHIFFEFPIFQIKIQVFKYTSLLKVKCY